MRFVIASHVGETVKPQSSELPRDCQRTTPNRVPLVFFQYRTICSDAIESSLLTGRGIAYVDNDCLNINNNPPFIGKRTGITCILKILLWLILSNSSASTSSLYLPCSAAH